MKNDQAVIVFYLSYVVWLFIVIFLSPDVFLLTLFTGAILLFYMLFLSDVMDIAWIIAGITIFIVVTIVKINGFEITFDNKMLAEIPVWVYLAWGTTVVALRRFFIIANK